MSYEAYDVVVVPFPFTDRSASKRRPALVLSDGAAFNASVGHSVLAMITSARHSEWPLDVNIGNLEAAGLPSPSVVRMKLFTLANDLVLRRIGALAKSYQTTLQFSINQLLRF